MDTKAMLIAPLTALLLAVSGAGLAATPSGDDTATTPNYQSGMMQDGSGYQMPPMRRGGMSDAGMMGGGMMGMMGSCPMLGAAGGPNGKVMMQMRGEMMRSMGEIMMKYADKLEMPPSSK